MDQQTISKIICDLEEQTEKLDNETLLLKSLTYLLIVLQEPSAYTNTKLNPVRELKDIIHWAILDFPILAKAVQNTKQLELSPKITAKRTLTAEGKFKIFAENFYPLKQATKSQEFDYDVCISFAGEQRVIANSIASKLKDEYFLKIFYDDFEKYKFWGEDHFNYLFDVYFRRCRYCILLLSKEYLDKNWTNHELKAVQMRMVRERGMYLLPIVLEEDLEMPIEFQNIGYLNYRPEDLDDICSAVNEKVWKEKSDHYLIAEEMAELINTGFRFRMFFSPFQLAVTSTKQTEEQLISFILGLVFTAPFLNLAKPVNALFEYLVYALPPIANRFDDNGEIGLFQPETRIRRSLTGNNNELLVMTKDFWEPIFAQWEKDYPQMFQNEESEEDIT